MYKLQILTIALVGSAIATSAQGASTTLWEQITALRGYVATTESGYRLVEQGLKGIKGINADEFQLHTTFFTNLSNVNPSLSNSPQVSAILQTELTMIEGFTAARARWRASPWLQPSEWQAIDQIQSLLLKDGSDCLTALQNLLSDNVFTASDGERLRAIERIASTLQVEAQQLARYITGTDVLLAARQRAQQETNVMQHWSCQF